jgi:hypothetical protein
LHRQESEVSAFVKTLMKLEHIYIYINNKSQSQITFQKP